MTDDMKAPEFVWIEPDGAARAQAIEECAALFHKEQLIIWAQEIGEALSEYLEFSQYDEKVEIFNLIEAELINIRSHIRALATKGGAE